MTGETICTEMVTEFNKAVETAKSVDLNGLFFPSLDQNDFSINVYAYAALKF